MKLKKVKEEPFFSIQNWIIAVDFKLKFQQLKQISKNWSWFESKFVAEVWSNLQLSLLSFVSFFIFIVIFLFEKLFSVFYLSRLMNNVWNSLFHDQGSVFARQIFIS